MNGKKMNGKKWSRWANAHRICANGGGTDA